MFGAANKIEAGTQVCHKGGGPLMVVEAIWDDDGCWVAGYSWFTSEDRSGIYEYVEIALDALDLVPTR